MTLILVSLVVILLKLQIIESARAGGDIPITHDDYELNDDVEYHNDFDNAHYDDTDYDPYQFCWSDLCKNSFGEDMRCHDCPEKEPVKKENLDLSITCGDSSAIMSFNLSKVLNQDLENLSISIGYREDGSQDDLVGLVTLDPEDEMVNEQEWENLCSGTKYQFCMSISHDHSSDFDDDNICEKCTPSGLPPHNPTNVRTSGGLTSFEVTWDSAVPQCMDTLYQVLLNGQPHDSPTKDLSQWVSHLDYGQYKVSVRAENTEGQCLDELSSSSYNIQEVIPPNDVTVTNDIIDGSLIALLSWNHSMEISKQDFTKKGYIIRMFNNKTNDEFDAEGDEIRLTFDENSFEYSLNDSLGWNTFFTIQTYVGTHKSNETDPQPLFSTFTPLKPPQAFPVENAVNQDVLSTFIVWDFPPEMQGFDGLGTLFKVWSKNISEPLSETFFPFPDSEKRLSLGTDIPWDSEVTLQIQVREETGKETERISLFGDIKLLPPKNPSIEHTVNNGSLTASVTWDHPLQIKGFSGLGTHVVLLSNTSGYILKEETILFPDRHITFDLDEDTPWDTTIFLQTVVNDTFSDTEQKLNLFGDIKLESPDNITVDHFVEEGNLFANISWETINEFGDFNSFGTKLEFIDDNSVVVHTEFPKNNIIVRLGQDGFQWGVRGRLQTIVVGGDSDMTESFSIFSSIELTPPEYIRTEHTVSETGELIAVISWDNAVTIGDEVVNDKVEGLGTMFIVLDNDLNILRKEKVPYPTNVHNIRFGSESQWNNKFSLLSYAEETNGEETNPSSLFSTIELPTPSVESVEYLVAENKSLMAVITWNTFVLLDLIPQVFDGLNTKLDLFDGDTETHLSTEVFPYTENKFQFYLSDPNSDWNTKFTLQTILEDKSQGDVTKGEATKMRGIFENFNLSPPKNINVNNMFIGDSVTAEVTWENTIVESFSSLETLITIFEGDKDKTTEIRRKRNTGLTEYKTIPLPYEETLYKFDLSTIPWDTQFRIQSIVGDWHGEQSKPQGLFTGVQLEPPGQITSEIQVLEDNLQTVISWEPMQGYADGTSPPIILKLWNDTEMISETILDNDDNMTIVTLDDNIPWSSSYTLEIKFSDKHVEITEPKLLFGDLVITPPVIVNTTSNDSSCLVEWEHTIDSFKELETIINYWLIEGDNQTVFNQTTVASGTNWAVFNRVGENSLPQATLVSLQSVVRKVESNHTELIPLFLEPIALKQMSGNRLLLIIGLSILLLMYIIATVFCLRSVKRQGTYRVKEEKNNILKSTPGKFSEYNSLLDPQQVGTANRSDKSPNSDDGESNNTEQESLMSDNSVPNLGNSPGCVFLGTSQITLNRFNDDDDFMGHFDEDGSFIGDYLEVHEETSQIVQNKLLAFSQMYKANGGHLTST